jgi:hypothetical protein
MKPGIAEHDLQRRPGRRIALHHPADFFFQILEHFAAHPFIMLRSLPAGADAQATARHIRRKATGVTISW